MGMVIYLYRATAGEVESFAADADAVGETIFDNGVRDRVIDFDKAWHALHFMLTGDAGRSAHPLTMLVTDDAHMLGTDERGFGGYWLIEPSAVRAFADALAAISDEALAARYDPAAMVANDLYMSDYFEHEGSEGLSYIMQWVPNLRSFSRAAADAGDYVIGVHG